MQKPIESPRAGLLPVSLLSVAAWLAASPLAAQTAEPSSGSEPVVAVRSEQSSLNIVERFSKITEFDARVTRVDGFDPEVINVTALSPRQLRVQALAPGVTTMVVTDENERVYSIEVFVAGDVRHLQAYIDRFFPKASVRAVAVRDSVVLRGWVTKPEHITELVEIANQFYPDVLNQMKVGGVQQVLLKVKVIEVQRSKIRRLGFNFLFRDQDSFVASTPGMLTPVGMISTAFGAPPAVALQDSALMDPTLSFGVVGDDAIFNGFLEALKQESLLKILSEPEVVTTNGRPASFLAGGEFPILVPQSLGTVTIEWREFGTRLEVVPIILGNDRLRLELQPEVSDRDFSSAVNVQGTVVPGLTSRRVNTQVEMQFGQTLMIAGLLSTRKTAVLDKIPVLGELPWVGAAFRRERFDETETELVILVTPELVAPLEPHQVIPGGPGLSTETPTDREFYLYGYPEVPNYSDNCYGCEPNFTGGLIAPDAQDGPGGARVVPGGAGRRGPIVPPTPSPSDGHSLPVPDSPRAGESPDSPRLSPPPAAEEAEPAEQPDSETGVEGALWEPSGQPRRGVRPARQSFPLQRSRRPGRARRKDRSRARPGLIEPKPGMIQPVSRESDR